MKDAIPMLSHWSCNNWYQHWFFHWQLKLKIKDNHVHVLWDIYITISRGVQSVEQIIISFKKTYIIYKATTSLPLSTAMASDKGQQGCCSWKDDWSWSNCHILHAHLIRAFWLVTDGGQYRSFWLQFKHNNGEVENRWMTEIVYS